MIYKFVASGDFVSYRPTNCEDTVVLKNKVNYLIKTASRVSMELQISMQFWEHKIVFLKMLTLDINMVSKESKRSSIVSLKIMKTNLHHLSLAFII